ncbi:hypothetical protein [Nostoc sp.]|uniref:hypothetical protein n=1 Tax=Nostoc sp. TaxID=1180 RepID=UPI002FFB2A49
MSQTVASQPVSKIQGRECICCDLVTFDPLLFYDNCQSSQNLRLILTINFCESKEEPIPLKDGSIVNIIFGIKRGNLECGLTNARMDLNKGNSFDNEIYNWRVMHCGIPEAPKWKFTLLNGSEFLEGSLKDQCLGIIDLLEVGKYFELEAIFKINVNRNHIKVICSDRGSVTKTKIQRESEIGLCLQYLQEKYRLDNYVSRVVVNI